MLITSCLLLAACECEASTRRQRVVVEGRLVYPRRSRHAVAVVHYNKVTQGVSVADSFISSHPRGLFQ